VLTGLNEANRGAFDSFVEGMAEALPPDLDTILAWVGRARRAAA